MLMLANLRVCVCTMSTRVLIVLANRAMFANWDHVAGPQNFKGQFKGLIRAFSKV